MKSKLWVLWILSVLFISVEAQEVLTEANKCYIAASETLDIKKREELLNQALRSYLSIESEHPIHYYHLGNCYYQLGESGLAMWSYTQAFLKDPRNKKIRYNLLQAYEKSGALSYAKKTFLMHRCIPTLLLNSFEKRIGFTLLAMTCFILFSLTLWFSNKKIKISAYALALVFTFTLISLGAEQWVYQDKLLVVQPVKLRCDAGKQYKAVQDELLDLGQSVQSIQLSEDKLWVKVRAGKKEGFVPIEALRAL